MGLYSYFCLLFDERLKKVKPQVRLKEYLIEHFVHVLVCLPYPGELITHLGSQPQSLLCDLLVPLRQDKARVFLKLAGELFDNLRLVEVGSLGFVKQGGLLPFLNIHQLQIVEPLLNQLQMRQVGKVFFDRLDAFVGIGIDGVGFRVDDRTELEDKLLEPKEVELLRFPLVEQLYIDVSHQVLDFVLGGQEEELVVFEELDDFDSLEGLVSLAVVLKVYVASDCILTAGVPEKYVPHDLVVLLE